MKIDDIKFESSILEPLPKSLPEPIVKKPVQPHPKPSPFAEKTAQPVSKPLPIAKKAIEKPIQQKAKKSPSWLSRVLNREFLTQILMPFLWQNIGWFIGGFCFVSGSIFLVAYTAGFYQALAIFAILNLYSLILFWGGYQIRRKRPELITSSNVLLTLGVLLVPLNITAAVRLIQSGIPQTEWVGLTILLSLITVGVFMAATSLASGLIERSLQGEHSRLFIGLATIQFAKPLFIWSFISLIFIFLWCILLKESTIFTLYVFELPTKLWSYFIGLAILLNFSFLYALKLRPRQLTANFFLVSLLYTTLLLLYDLVNIPLLLTLWATILLLAVKNLTHTVLVKAINYWIPVSFIAALASVVYFSNISLTGQLFTITWLASLSLAIGILNQRMSKLWLFTSAILFIGVIHAIWLVWFPNADPLTLLPWYTLQDILLANFLFWFKDKDSTNKTNLSWLPSWVNPLLVTLTVLAWLGHSISLLELASFSAWDNYAAILAGILLIRFWWLNNTSKEQDRSIYILSIMVALLGIYLRIFWFGFASFNVWDTASLMALGIYLWIPALAANSKLLQLYIIPISISVLLMLQLHHLELKPKVLNAIRMTALSALYAGATLDVFIRPELSIFLLAIDLSLAGIILGIALRVKAFLYLGTIFLVLNVLGQLLDFYPEDRLSKAIILMVLGGLITGSMIWFNIQREALMQRIRIIRADLAQWE